MEPELKGVQADRNRDPNRQILTDSVVRILRQDATSPGLTGMLIRIVRDNARWPRVRTAALDVFIGFHHSEDKASKLKALRADIH